MEIWKHAEGNRYNLLRVLFWMNWEKLCKFIEGIIPEELRQIMQTL